MAIRGKRIYLNAAPNQLVAVDYQGALIKQGRWDLIAANWEIKIQLCCMNQLHKLPKKALEHSISEPIAICFDLNIYNYTKLKAHKTFALKKSM